MNKENNRSAAGLRRSAIAERIRLREEWSALKEVDTATTSIQADRVLRKKPGNARCTPSVTSSKKQPTSVASKKKENPKAMQVSSDVLRGVVVLVDVGAESRALPLRYTLASLGATVVMDWSPLVTHLVWNDSGSRATRAKARALACRLVSPLWVEACAASACKLSERAFPAASRQSDLPSPRTLRQLLKRAEMENIPLVDLLSDSKEENDRQPRLRISSETDTSNNKTTDTSADTVDIETRVNTAPRRAMVEPASREPPKSRRKLFTHKEAPDISSSGDETEADTRTKNTLQQHKLTQRERRDLARAERMAKKLLAACNTSRNNNDKQVAIHVTQNNLKPKIVLTGMSRLERQAVTKSIQSLNGFVQKHVNKRTTHVLLGSCRNNVGCSNHPSNITGVATHCDLSKSGCWSDATDKRARTCNALQGAARGCRVLHARWAIESAAAGKWLHHHGYEVEHLKKICQKARVERTALGRLNSEYAYDVFNGMRVHLKPDAEQREAALQLLTLCGAAVDNNEPNNCLSGRPTPNIARSGQPTPNIARSGQPTPNIARSGQPTPNIARSGQPTPNIARSGQPTPNIARSGQPTQNIAQSGQTISNIARSGQLPQNGVQTASNHQYDVIIGSGVGEVNSKWVFDSVASARMRTTRRYINMNSFSNDTDDIMCNRNS